MDEKRALDILIANACCVSAKITCDKCPFDGTKIVKNWFSMMYWNKRLILQI